jgi:hypothetical protein
MELRLKLAGDERNVLWKWLEANRQDFIPTK